MHLHFGSPDCPAHAWLTSVQGVIYLIQTSPSAFLHLTVQNEHESEQINDAKLNILQL